MFGRKLILKWYKHKLRSLFVPGKVFLQFTTLYINYHLCLSDYVNSFRIYLVRQKDLFWGFSPLISSSLPEYFNLTFDYFSMDVDPTGKIVNIRETSWILFTESWGTRYVERLFFGNGLLFIKFTRETLSFGDPGSIGSTVTSLILLVSTWKNY